MSVYVDGSVVLVLKPKLADQADRRPLKQPLVRCPSPLANLVQERP